MGGNGGPSPLPDFTRARTVAGLILITVASMIALIDTLRTDVTVDAFQFYGLVGVGAALLGVGIVIDRIFKP